MRLSSLLRTCSTLEDVPEAGSELEHELELTRILGEILDDEIFVNARGDEPLPPHRDHRVSVSESAHAAATTRAE
jgi:hypothetical protein